MQGEFATVFEAANEKGISHMQLALAWLLSHPSIVFPAVGTSKPERLIEAARASGMRLDLQDWFAMLKAAMGREMP